MHNHDYFPTRFVIAAEAAIPMKVEKDSGFRRNDGLLKSHAILDVVIKERCLPVAATMEDVADDQIAVSSD